MNYSNGIYTVHIFNSNKSFRAIEFTADSMTDAACKARSLAGQYHAFEGRWNVYKAKKGDTLKAPFQAFEGGNIVAWRD